MADKKDSAKKAAPAAKGKKEKSLGKKGGGRIKLLILIVVIAGVCMPAVGLIMLAGMIPSLVMSFTDRSRNKALSVCVSVPNAAGCLQVVLSLPGVMAIDHAISMLSKPETFLIMWGAAGIGFGLFSFIPPMVGGVLVNMAGMKITRLRHNQKELKRIWGDDVGGRLN